MRFMNRLTRHICLLLAMTTVSVAANAQNVDLSTVPQRDTVQLTIYNSEDLTLVRETRRLTFSEGMNPLQFSWANTLIDPSSVELRFLTHANQLDLLDTTYPHDKPQMLYWNVRSRIDGEAVVEITYFTSGISWEADYVAIANEDETNLAFDGFVRITNRSGEDYSNAQIRLVVGTINLVEKVRELAERGIISKNVAERYYQGGRLDAAPAPAREMMRDEVRSRLNQFGGGGQAAPKEIIKEGLSEYFIYTIEGEETVRNNWSKRLRLFEGTDSPFRIQYRYRPAEYGDQLVRLYLLKNDEKSNLGTTPLPDGLVRLFRNNGRDGLSFLVEHQIDYVPIGQEIELVLDQDPEVILERTRLNTRRDNFWFRHTDGRRLINADGQTRIENNWPVAGWNEHETWVERIRNYRDKAIEVEIRLSFNGDVEFISGLNPTLFDFRSPQFTATIPAMTTRDLEYILIHRMGSNAKQNAVQLTTPE